MVVRKWPLGLSNHLVTTRLDEEDKPMCGESRKEVRAHPGTWRWSPWINKSETAWPPDFFLCEIMYFAVVVVVQTTFTSSLLASITYWGPKKHLYLTSSTFSAEGNQETALESTTSRKTAKIKPRCIAGAHLIQTFSIPCLKRLLGKWLQAKGKICKTHSPTSWLTLNNETESFTFYFSHYKSNMCACMHGKWIQSCLILCEPMDCSPPGSSVHGILRARILECVATPFSRNVCVRL